MVEIFSYWTFTETLAIGFQNWFNPEWNDFEVFCWNMLRFVIVISARTDKSKNSSFMFAFEDIKSLRWLIRLVFQPVRYLSLKVLAVRYSENHFMNSINEGNFLFLIWSVFWLFCLASNDEHFFGYFKEPVFRFQRFFLLLIVSRSSNPFNAVSVFGRIEV